MLSDTIAALATPHGTGAVCVLRVSGPQTCDVVGKVWQGRSPPQDWQPRQMKRGKILGDGGYVIDDVLAVRFVAPASFTGEEVIEIHGHGGQLVAQLLLESLIKAGARPAGPGEFSQRAFLNGKLDLAQAEAVMDLISAQTALALRAANQQLAGGLSEIVLSLRLDLISLLAHIEAYIDFPEEDIDPETGHALITRVAKCRSIISMLLDTAELGRILRHGLRLVIAGAPNAGKSSLLNLLLGFDRAIVSPEAGTTRDTVEETIDLSGVPVRLIDTAGLREHDAGHIEQLGMERTHDALNTADVLLEVVDGTQNPSDAYRVTPPEGIPHHLLVLNKCDLGLHPGWAGISATALSCTTREGLEDLVAAIKCEVSASATALDGSPLAINARHQQCLRRATDALAAAESLLAEHAEPEITAEEIRTALHAVGDIIGRVDAEDILGAIFSGFCIGK